MKLELTNHFILRKIVDESVLVPVSPSVKERDTLYVCNATARAIYEGLKKGLSLEEIKNALCEEFEGVPSTELDGDIQSILSQWTEIGAIRELRSR